MKRLIIVILAVLCSFSQPVAADSSDLYSIRERLSFLVNISDMSRVDRFRLEDKIADINEDLFKKSGIDVKAFDRYLEELITGDMLDRDSDYFEIQGRRVERIGKAGKSFSWGKVAGFTFLGILLLPLAALVFIPALVIAAYAALVAVYMLAVSAFVWVPLLIIGLCGGFQSINASLAGKNRNRFLFKMRHDVAVNFALVAKTEVAVPDQLASFHLNYMTQKEDALEKALKSGSLVKDLVAALG